MVRRIKVNHKLKALYIRLRDELLKIETRPNFLSVRTDTGDVEKEEEWAALAGE